VETILCPGCGEENPARFKLCGFCGTALARVPEVVQCPACGEENPGKFRLCGYCGTPLGTQPPVAPGTDSPGPGPGAGLPAAAAVAPPVALPAREVRKLVTLVFSDLKDSTALTASIDAEAMNEIKARYFSTMAAEIERHGGKVEKNIGDAIMAVFGLIRAREDDALLAVRAAAGMQQALAELNDELGRVYGVTLTNRTGVNTGEIVANTDPNATQNLATGDAVNVAARLEQNAPANEILMGEMTHALVRDNVEVERLELQLKGKAELVTAYRLVAVRTAPATARAADAPFIGRQFEMDILMGAFAEIAGTPVPRLVTVIGDAGVGKTRLVADFLRQVADRATILRGRCLAWGDGITFWPLLEVVRQAAGIGEDDSTEAAHQKVAALIPSTDPERDAIVDRVTSAIGLAGGSFPVAELFWGARKLLEAQAATRPLVVVVDDIHWAEETFLDFLGHVVESARAASILLVCTARSELLDENLQWTEQPKFERIDLKPLGASDVEAMIDALLGKAAVSDAVRAKVVAAAEGNPLYVEQMISHLRERAGGSDDDEVVVPPTIHALLAARLDALSREERAIVDPASVIGLVFPEPAIEELVPDAIRPTVTAYLSGLERKQFVHALDGGDDPAFRFHHILVRDAAYQSLLKRARATLHERFVTWAERVNRERDRETEFEEILGYHLEQAVRYRSELGPLDSTGREIADRAATKLAGAGRRAFSRGDTPAACNLLRRAAALLPADQPSRIELLTELADALMEEGAFDEAAASLDEARDGAARIGDERLAARATLGRRTLDLHVSAGGLGEVLVDAGSAIRTFEAAGDEAGLARAWRLMMLVHGTTGAYDEAASAAKLVVDHARAAGDARLATRGAIGYAVSALHGPTPASEALRRSEQLVVDVAGDRKAEAVISGVLAQLHAMRGDFERGRELYGRARSMLHDLGPSVTAASTSTESSRVEILAGDVAAAERELRRDYAALTELGEQYYLSTVAALLAGVLEARDELAEAEALSRSAEALADDGDVFSQVAWRGARARVLARTDRLDEAERLARQAVAMAAGTVDITLHADALADLATVLATIGRRDDADELWGQALALYERKEDLVSAERIRARLADTVRA
jgi:predicted ATPase/class 3 adenylate cyclase